MSNNENVEDLLSDFIEIKSPGLLYDVVDSLNDFVKLGLIRQISGRVRLEDIKRGLPFPDDIIEISLETITNRTRYHLNCETYHGMGGAFWRDGYDKK